MVRDRKPTTKQWDEAIIYARRQLERAERRVERLQSAIRTYEWNRDHGFLWPGSAKRTEVIPAHRCFAMVYGARANDE